MGLDSLSFFGSWRIVISVFTECYILRKIGIEISVFTESNILKGFVIRELIEVKTMFAIKKFVRRSPKQMSSLTCNIGFSLYLLVTAVTFVFISYICNFDFIK
ncbi:hypothetical protein I3842_06G062000 [Carya illinoinensis]|uniref:Uncharacterized protein n=1 Tax=Carya illinoinensis TaxID=32201 RepID=A0A922EUZ7_CARIL|nr:hypothetical protein I3842_06G062000 [Carya illinoinensis]